MYSVNGNQFYLKRLTLFSKLLKLFFSLTAHIYINISDLIKKNLLQQLIDNFLDIYYPLII